MYCGQDLGIKWETDVSVHMSLPTKFYQVVCLIHLWSAQEKQDGSILLLGIALPVLSQNQ